MLCLFLLQPLENIKTNRICLHFSGIYKEIVINQENLHVGLVLSCRMTTSWMCCSCWWLWCLNILVPWSRLLTSATGFGKHGCIILALVSIVFFFRFTTYLSVISSFRTVLSCIWGLNVTSSWWNLFSLYIIEPLFFFPQCDFQAFGLKKRRNTSAGAESNWIFSETHASKVSTVRNLKSRVLNCSLNTFRLY